MDDLIRRQDAIDVVAGIDKYFVKYIEDLPAAQPEPKWIPVSERLPETDEIVLVTAKPKKGLPNVNRAYYFNGFWHGSGSMSNVIAWMPLPEPYKEE